MRYKKKQKSIEEKTERIIDDLANEFELDIKTYPEIYWLGNNRKFESLGINELYKERFINTKRIKRAIYLNRERIILSASNQDKVLAEEAGHFLHFENSGIDPARRNLDNPQDYYSLKIIAEAIGFFSSKLIDSRRKLYLKEYKNFRDFIAKSLESNGIHYNNLEAKAWENYALKDKFFIYKQGYSLGNELFNNYLAGDINRKQIKRLIKNPFKENFSATEKLLYLRKRFMKNKLSR